MTTYLSNAFSLSMLPDKVLGNFIPSIEIIPFDEKVLLDYLSRRKKIVSCIGHESTAKLVSSILKTEIAVNRQSIMLQEDDELIVFQLMTRLEEGKVLTEEEISKLQYRWYLVTVS